MKLSFNPTLPVKSQYSTTKKQNTESTPSFGSDVKELVNNIPDMVNNIPNFVKFGAAILAGLLTIGVCAKKGVFSKIFKKAEVVDETQKALGDLWRKMHDNRTGNRLIDQRTLFTQRVILEPKIKELGARTHGVCILGPDSQGKEKLLSEVIKELADDGYNIVHIPRYKDGNYKEIILALDNAMKSSRELFTKEGKRSAIIVRDLQELAIDRNLDHPSFHVAAKLLQTEHALEDGYVWISESKYCKNLDPAVIRYGRIDMTLTAKPLATDSKEAWLSYLARQKEAVDNPHWYEGGIERHKWFYEDALASIPKEYLS